MSSEDNTDTQALLAGRESVYGNRVDNMERVAQMWNGYLGTDVITPADVAMMFTLYKAYRFKVTPDYSDNINDVVTHRRHFQAQKTECARGHEFTLENTRIGTRGERICRSCARARSAAYKSKRKTRKP